MHGYDLYDEQIPSGYQPFKRVMDERLERVVFISQYGMDYYLKKYRHFLYDILLFQSFY